MGGQARVSVTEKSHKKRVIILIYHVEVVKKEVDRSLLESGE